MSRIPLGLWLSCLFLSAGCASMFAPTARRPGMTQQQTLPQPVNIPVSEPINPQSRPYGSGGNRFDDSQHIELGEPTSFPQSSKGPVTAQKPVSSENGARQDVLPKHVLSQAPSQENIEANGAVLDWETRFLSSDGRAIELTQAGLGKYRILILGSIYGNEPESIELMDAITRESSSFAQSPSYMFALLRTPNPDGLIEHIRTNRNGVDLNRNFPSTWFTATPNRLTGPHPASEVETQNLMRILKGFQPHRVVHVRSSIGQRPLILVNDQLAHSVNQICQSLPVDAGAFRGEYKAGSLEEFTTVRINAELMVVHLPPKGFQQLAARELFQLATMNFDAQKVSPTEEGIATNSTPTTSLEKRVTSNQSEVPAPDGEKGYVEFLPPPPGSSPINQASKSAPLGDPKFYELPPPPGH